MVDHAKAELVNPPLQAADWEAEYKCASCYATFKATAECIICTESWYTNYEVPCPACKNPARLENLPLSVRRVAYAKWDVKEKTRRAKLAADDALYWSKIYRFAGHAIAITVVVAIILKIQFVWWPW